MGKGKRRQFSEEFREEAVRLARESDRSARAIAAELGNCAPFERGSNMKDAVVRSFKAAEKGDVVLLAPACASFDMFESFEHRGKVFKAEVSALT